MPGEVPEIISGMGSWAIYLYNGLTVAGIAGFGLWQYVKARSKAEGERAEEHEHFDAEDLLETSPVKAFLANVNTLADAAKLQTEALRTISAALVTLAKIYEQDFDEMRIRIAVQERFDAEEARRERERERWAAQQRPPPPAPGWGGG
jgi:hypothetical protein